MPPASRARGPSLSLIGALCIIVAILVSGYIGVLVATRGGRPSSEEGNLKARILKRLAARRRLGKDSVKISTLDDEDISALQLAGVDENGIECPTCPTCPVCQPQIPAVTLLTAAHHLHNSRRYHIVTTTAGFSNHWQVRIHYYWYKKQKETCEGQAVCDMGGFTRLLHTGHADDLMDEVPTVVVNPLPKSAFGGQDSSYIVLNRPYAFVEWLKTASIPERYILMCESDHLIMRPIPNMMVGEVSAAALFSYMEPTKYPDEVRSLLGDISNEELATIPRIGNSPTFISTQQMKLQAPAWYNMTMDIWKNEKAHKAWNWVLEMYGYALATYRAGINKTCIRA